MPLRRFALNFASQNARFLRGNLARGHSRCVPEAAMDEDAPAGREDHDVR